MKVGDAVRVTSLIDYSLYNKTGVVKHMARSRRRVSIMFNNRSLGVWMWVSHLEIIKPVRKTIWK